MPRAQAMSAQDRDIGNRIKLRRLGAGMTQMALAERMGISFQQVQKYEKGVNRVSSHRLRLLCDILNCTTDSIVSEVPVFCASDPDIIAETMSSREGQRMMAVFLRMPGEMRRRFILLGESITGMDTANVQEAL